MYESYPTRQDQNPANLYRQETGCVRRGHRLTAIVIIFLVLSLGLSLAWSQNDVLTQHNDNTRSGLNSNEKILTPANVTVNTFGKLFTHSVDGIIVGQPLYASNVLMNDGLTHNVVYVATQHNTVYAFDADNIRGNNASPLWSVSLDDGGTSDPIADFGCTGTHYTEIGAMSTPVIDPGKTTLYVVAKTVNGSVRNFTLHALSISTGSDLVPAAIITGSAPSSNGSGTFNPVYQMQRPALLLQGTTVYIGFGGNGCDVYAYNGWFFAYNSQTLQQEAAFLVTPDGTRASIWQGGSGPAVDEFGNIYVVTANGTYDGPVGGNDFGDSVLKMGWTGNTFGVLDYFTPYNQSQLSQQDLDLGSSGALILPDQPGLYPHELIAGGKQGTLYLVNRDNPGQFNAAADNVIQSIPGAVVGELVGAPSYWNGSVYIAGDGDFIKQFQLVNGMLTAQPVSETTLAFAGSGPSSTSITASGATNGILWAIQHSNGILYAFDATNLANQFYNTTQAKQSRDKMVPVVRFVTPTISNGKLFIGGKSALEAYGLLPTLTTATGNNQSGTEKAVLPVPLTLLASDSYTSNPIPGVTIICEDGGAGGLFTPKEAQTTDTNGHIVYTYQLPSKPRAVSIVCTSLGYVSTVFSETVTVGAPTHLAIASGNNQTAPPSTPLGAPLVIKVYDAHSYGVAGVTVSLTDNGAGGSFASTSIVSDSTGTVTAFYTTGPNAGKVVITASAPGLNSFKMGATVE